MVISYSADTSIVRWRNFMLHNENIPSKTVNEENIEKNCVKVVLTLIYHVIYCFFNWNVHLRNLRTKVALKI